MIKTEDLGFWGTDADKYITLERESRKEILFPAVEKILHLTADSRLLDYGGGDGGFLENMRWNGDKYLYDPSPQMVEFARAHRKKIRAVYEDDAAIPDHGFDAVSLIHVVTVIKQDAELIRIFERIFALLVEGGQFVIGMTHPAFKNNQFSTFYTQFARDLPFDYLNSGLPYSLHLQPGGGKPDVVFECYHRPLSVLLNMALRTGFVLRQMQEIPDRDPDNPQKRFLFPPFAILNFTKPKG